MLMYYLTHYCAETLRPIYEETMFYFLSLMMACWASAPHEPVVIILD